MDKHKKTYGVYHWDTFEEGEDAIMLIGEFDELLEARHFIQMKYKGRISMSGADRVDIVNKNGKVVDFYTVG